MTSLAECLASLSEAERRELTAGLTDQDIRELNFKWEFWARQNQLPPLGDWTTWLILAGRGFGKTRCGAEFVRSQVCGSTPLAAGAARRVALVAETAADARDVLVEGGAGLLAVHPPDFRPLYEPSKRRLTWPNGAVATTFNAREPDQLRGPEHDLSWCDELAKWRYVQETWDMLQFGMRIGDHPRQVITTTPRPIKLVKEIMADPTTVTTSGSTYENRANLAPAFFQKIVKRYEGTRLGRQELKAEILDDVPGALWTRANLDENRRTASGLPDMQRIVVSVDPADGSDDEGASEVGIAVAGLGSDGRGYFLADLSCRLGPTGWARRAVSGYDLHNADAIVAEINNGGAMVESTIQTVRESIPVITVRATRGKVTRAEPIAALYEQNRVSHVGSFPELEDQLVMFTPYGIESETTADRADALVWAFTELFPDIIQVDRPDMDKDWRPEPLGEGGYLAS